MDRTMHQSPLAQAFATIIAKHESERAIEFAALQARASRRATEREAYEHALRCLDARDGWDEETLGHNIESSFPELDPDECDDIARAAMAKRTSDSAASPTGGEG